MQCVSCKNEIYSEYYTVRSDVLCRNCEPLERMKIEIGTDEQGLSPYLIIITVACITAWLWHVAAMSLGTYFILSPAAAGILALTGRKILSEKPSASRILLILFFCILVGGSMIFFIATYPESGGENIGRTDMLIEYMAWVFGESAKTSMGVVVVSFYILLKVRNRGPREIQGPHPFSEGKKVENIEYMGKKIAEDHKIFDPSKYSKGLKGREGPPGSRSHKDEV